jgi:hypothetical protein
MNNYRTSDGWNGAHISHAVQLLQAQRANCNLAGGGMTCIKNRHAAFGVS